MRFKNESEKRKFVETMLNKGIDEAKKKYLNQMEGIIIVETGKTVELFGETLTAAEVKQRYPQAVVIELTAEEMNL